MRITRRTLLVGAGSGAAAVLLAACAPEPPRPTPSVPTVSPTPTGAVPAPSAFLRSAWTTDPLARGAKTFVPAGVGLAAREQLAEPLDDRVFFAGEALGDPIGTIQGASRDGVRAATALADVAAEGERVFVIGAGIAGARAARFLADAGFSVTVIEGRDRIGGRIHQVESDDWPVTPQLGAWLVPSDADEVHARLEELGIALHALAGQDARSGDGQLEPPSPEAVERAISWAAEAPADLSILEALEASGADPEQDAIAAYLDFLAAHTGAGADRLSSWYPPSLPDPAASAVDGDLQRLVADPLEGIDVSMSTTVLGISYGRDGVSLRLATGEALSADRVILTAPLGVLQRGSIEFDPALPFPYRGAIAALGAGTVEVAWLRFDEPFWQTEAAVWHLVGGDALVRTWINLAPSTGEPILVGIVGGEAAAEFAELDDGDAAQAAIDALGFFSGA